MLVSLPAQRTRTQTLGRRPYHHNQSVRTDLKQLDNRLLAYVHSEDLDLERRRQRPHNLEQLPLVKRQHGDTRIRVSRPVITSNLLK